MLEMLSTIPILQELILWQTFFCLRKITLDSSPYTTQSRMRTERNHAKVLTIYNNNKCELITNTNKQKNLFERK